jgi:hypothetical protein
VIFELTDKPLMDWELLEREISSHFSVQGAPALLVRLMVSLMYL